MNVAATDVDVKDVVTTDTSGLDAYSHDRRRRRRSKKGMSEYRSPVYDQSTPALSSSCSHGAIYQQSSHQLDRLDRLEAVVEEQAALIAKLTQCNESSIPKPSRPELSSTTSKAHHEADQMESGTGKAEVAEIMGDADGIPKPRDVSCSSWIRAPPADGVVAAIPLAVIEQVRHAVASGGNRPTAFASLSLCSLVLLFCVTAALLVQRHQRYPQGIVLTGWAAEQNCPSKL